MNSEAQVVLIGGIISAASALAGTYFGWWLNRRTERRNEKRAALAELLAAMDNCQHACDELSDGITRKWEDAVLMIPRSRALAAANRVETAVNLAVFIVGPKHEQTMKDAGVACAHEVQNANHGTDTTGIQNARKAIEKLGQKKLG